MNNLEDNVTMTDTLKEVSNTVSIEEEVDKMDQETNMESTESVAFEMEDNSTISNEYYETKLAEMEEMNYIEIMKMNRNMKYEKDSLEKAKDSVEQIIEMQEEMKKASESDDNLASSIAKADVETNHNLDDIHKFLDSYDDTMDKLTKLIERSEEIIKTFDDIPKTTSYMNKSMLEIVDKNLDKLNKLPASSMKQAKIYYKNFKEILTNQTSVDFIVEKLPEKQIMIRRLKDSLKKDRNGNVLKSTQKKVSTIFTQMFRVEQMNAFESYLQELWDNEEMVFYFQYALSLIYQHEKETNKYGKHKWVEILIMNIIDIVNDNYDLDGGKIAYDRELMKIYEAMYPILGYNKTLQPKND